MTAASTFSCTLVQGGVDITSRLARSGVQVRGRVLGARTCSYTYHIIGDGAVSLTELVGATVVVSGNVGLGAEVIFTGNITRTPSYDTNTRTLSIQATDNWQETLDGKTQAQLEAAIPNAVSYREDLDGPRVSGMQQALALLSTTPEDLYLDREGVLTVTSWTPKNSGSEDGTVDSSDVRDVVPEFLQLDELINVVVITYEHRFSRRVWNAVTFSWSFGAPGFSDPWTSWCQWYQTSGHDLPTKDEITQAANGTGWPINGGISFKGHPDTFGPGTGSLPCGPNIGWVLSDYLMNESIGASWMGGQTFSVEGLEILTLTVSSASSISSYGSHTGELSFRAETPYPEDSVDADQNPEEPSGFTAYGSGDTQSYSDEMDTDQRGGNIEAALNKARTWIWETHRRNRVTWTMLFDPTIDLGQTWTIDHPLVDARGVISELQHDITRESALTRVTIQCFAGGGGSDDTLVAPAFAPSAPTESAPAGVTVANKIGGLVSSPDYDSTWAEGSYFTGNHPPSLEGSANADDYPEKIYPVAFRVLGPDIPEASREVLSVISSGTFAIVIPSTTISVSGG